MPPTKAEFLEVRSLLTRRFTESVKLVDQIEMLRKTVPGEVEPDRLVSGVERVCSIPREDFCGRSKSGPAIMAEEMLILIGLQMSASMKLLSEIIGISPSALSRRHDAARRKVRDNANTSKLASEITRHYLSGE